MCCCVPVDILRESGENDTSVVIVEHMNKRVEYERVARTRVMRQNYNIINSFPPRTAGMTHYIVYGF